MFEFVYLLLFLYFYFYLFCLIIVINVIHIRNVTAFFCIQRLFVMSVVFVGGDFVREILRFL